MRFVLAILLSASLSGCFSHPDGFCDECKKSSAMLIIHQTCKKESWEWLNSPEELQPSPVDVLGEREKGFKLADDVERFMRDAMPDVAIRRSVILKKYIRMKLNYVEMTENATNVFSEHAKKMITRKSEELHGNCVEVAESYIHLNRKIEEVYAKYKTTSFLVDDSTRDSAIGDLEETLLDIEKITIDVEKHP